MNLSNLLKSVRVLREPDTDVEITYITDDSRKVRPGCAFVCIEGQKFDGHSAAGAAVAAGAKAVIAQKDTGLAQQVIVEDTREAYSLMCANFFGNPASGLKLVGVTGTNGKTTSCFLIKDLFEAVGEKTGLIGTIKNMVGNEEYPAKLTTPDPFELHELFLKMLEQGCTYCVMEVSSQALAQKRVAGLHFAAAIFTNLTQDHLDYHGSMENYRAAKKKLFGMTELAIINLDDEAAVYMTEGLKCKVVTFSVKMDESDYTAKNLQLKDTGAEYELVGHSVIGRVRFCVPGLFSVYNSMGAAVCAIEMGMPFNKVIEILAKTKGVPGRLEVLETGTDFSVVIDYAHSPDGLENILRTLNGIKKGRLITVFGCGGDRDKSKRPIMGRIAAQLSDIAIVTSDNPRSENPEKILADVLEGTKKSKSTVYAEVDRNKAIELAIKKAKAGDIVLLAGKGHETYQVLSMGKIHFDEREIVAKILSNK